MIEVDVRAVDAPGPVRAALEARMPSVHTGARYLRLRLDRLRAKVIDPKELGDRAGTFAALARELTNSRVAHGPFEGLRYISKSAGSEYPPKLIGTYELELFATWGKVRQNGYRKLVNVGAGEGYYAVGFTRLIPGIRVIGYESQPASRAMADDLARLNDASSAVEMNGACNPTDLRDALAGEPNQLLVCDAEGAEDALLRPNDVPALRATDILVETHDFIRPGITAELVRRFATTHLIEIVPSCPRELADWPAVLRATATTDDERLTLMWEARPAPMAWLWLQRKRSEVQL